MAKKEESKVSTSPVSLKTVKLSAAEISVIQSLNSQKKELDAQIMATVQSVLETRDIDQTSIVGGLSFTEDLKAITFTIKAAVTTAPVTAQESEDGGKF